VIQPIELLQECRNLFSPQSLASLYGDLARHGLQ
jgi:hypothetical protein